MARIDCHAALASRVPNAGLQRNGLPNNEDCAGGPDLRGCGDRATPAESHGRCDYRHHSFKSREINEAAFRGVEMPPSGNENTLSWPGIITPRRARSTCRPCHSNHALTDLQMLLRFGEFETLCFGSGRHKQSDSRYTNLGKGAARDVGRELVEMDGDGPHAPARQNCMRNAPIAIGSGV
jgi:hypothetical protein